MVKFPPEDRLPYIVGMTEAKAIKVASVCRVPANALYKGVSPPKLIPPVLATLWAKVNAAPGVEVPIPTFPPEVTVNNETPEVDVMLNGSTVAEPVRESFVSGVVVPTPTFPVVGAMLIIPLVA